MEQQTILTISKLNKLFGMDKKKAADLRRKGKTKEEVFKKTGVTVGLWDINLEIKKGEVFVIIGLSGSGKSTLVRCLNGLNKPSSGHVFYNEDDIFKYNKQEMRSYRREKVSMVFQHFGLINHRTVLENVAFGLEIKGLSKEEREQKALDMIDMVGLKGWENEPIVSLSGGMKQRVGIARALANNTEILLMDEPFSALDPLVRNDMQFELLSIQRKLNKTIVFITHDINEAFKLGDRVAIMKDGEVIQVATPEEMSANPKTDYVEKFIDTADKTQVISVKNVMINPYSLVHLNDSPIFAIRQMRNSDVVSSFVVDQKMTFLGVITLDDAVQAKKENKPLSEILITDVYTSAADDTLVDVMPKITQSRFPIAVLDENKKLEGIISKAHVLASML